MSSIIPKIKVGLATSKRNKLNLSFDCSTTSNIGNIQPTMCREMVPNSKMKVKVSSLVRLASMPLPTFGRMSLRHYHAFIPYQDVYEPFNAMMSGQHYTASGTTWIPTSVPYFTMLDVIPMILNYSDITICEANNINKPMQITVDNISTRDGSVFEYGDGKTYPTYDAAVRAAQSYDLDQIQTAWDAVRAGTGIFGSGNESYRLYSDRPSVISPTFKNDELGMLNFGAMGCKCGGSMAASGLKISYSDTEGSIFYTGGTPITPEGADLITEVNGYPLLLKFNPILKRLRTIFIGLGYQFSPYNPGNLSVLKLFAYYKGWYCLFSPNREKSFVDTTCYKLIKYFSTNASYNVSANELFIEFLRNLAKDCFYYLPMDYFSMSVITPQNSNQDTAFYMQSGASSMAGSTVDGVRSAYDEVSQRAYSTSNAQQGGNIHFSASTVGQLNPMTMKLAFQMLKWANKNTVIGRSIRDYLKVHFGITDTDDHESDSVRFIGSSRTNVTISDVMSTAESEQGYLGEYGGKGIGYGDSETFDYTAKNFGVWITYTVVVPESGYFQGYLKENRHLNRYQFFNPEFDALGYQVLERGEVMDDYNSDSSAWNPRSGYDRTVAFGLVPRYSEYKVGRNIVNGDLSLAGLYNSMAPYTLDRRIAGGQYGYSGYTVPGGPMTTMVKPNYVPSVIYDGFRRIDPTDHLGQYNRIFNYGGNDLDHFIIHNVFDVVAFAPMKPLTSSFDTVDEGERTIDMTHS